MQSSIYIGRSTASSPRQVCIIARKTGEERHRQKPPRLETETGWDPCWEAWRTLRPQIRSPALRLYSVGQFVSFNLLFCLEHSSKGVVLIRK